MSGLCGKQVAKKDRWKGQFSPADTSRSKHLCMTAHASRNFFYIYFQGELEQSFEQI